MQNFYKKGITLVESLVVISIIGILAAIVSPQFAKIKENQVLKNAGSYILATLNKAHSQTLASLNSSEYGVHFQSDKVVIFRGTIYIPNDVNNESIDLITPAIISNVILGGVSSTTGDVYFSRLSGVPNKIGTITISTTSYSKIITISAAGGFSITSATGGSSIISETGDSSIKSTTEVFDRN